MAMQLLIKMAQGFRFRLEGAVEKLGGEVLVNGFSESATSWQVLVEFPSRTKQRDVAQVLWSTFPGASVTVEAPLCKACDRAVRSVDDRGYCRTCVRSQRNAQLRAEVAK